MKTNELVDSIFELFRAQGETLALAESCTGGLLSAQITRKAGISEIFLGSVVCYANSVKEGVLRVSSVTLKNHGAVSSPVALEMAKNVQKNLRSSWAISITGIAGPDGGSLDKPVGTVWFGIVGPKIEYTEKRVFVGGRDEIREQATQAALELVLKFFKKGEKNGI